MLLELAVKNVALNAEARMEFQPGLTCITGETGAGKSLTVDALGLALGGRADAALIKEGAERAEAAALFAISPELKARLKEGYSVEDFKKVIDIKVAEWLNDENMSKFLRPETLFSNKFEGYLNQKPKQEVKKRIKKDPYASIKER